MARGLARGMTRGRLRAVLGALFLVLALPTAALVLQTQRQLRWEAYHQYGTLADELALRIDAELQRLVATEEARGYAEYGFRVVGEGGAQALLQRSPLSQLDAVDALPGALGWFQLDAGGRFRTPLLPDPDAPQDDALSLEERREREARAARLQRVLAGEAAQDKDRATAAQERDGAGSKREDAQAASNDAVFDALSAASVAPPAPPTALGRVDELQVDTRYQAANLDREARSALRLAEQRQKVGNAARGLRKEQVAEAVFQDRAGADAAGGAAGPAGVRLFESELDPMQFRRLDAQHGLLYRRVWRDGARGLQGVVVALPEFLERVVVAPFRGSALAPATELVIALDGQVQRVVAPARRRDYLAASEVQGELLHQVRLSAPFDDLQLLWSARDLPAGPGARLVGWTAAVLFLTLALGLYALYRLGLRQIALAAQQRDFVSAVSHELKTPLTSIRMYAEMLRAGWPPEAKRAEYYAFIHDESERLSRLIGNVLQLARLERDELALQPRPIAGTALLDMLRSKLQTQIDGAGFALEMRAERGLQEAAVRVDPDAFVQVMINLADNALKFAARAECRTLELELRRAGRERVEFGLRDHGPGVPVELRQRIFEPFRRGGSELTREAPGTGIGLALARQLARAMHGELECRPASPGVEFVLTLPLAADEPAATP